MAVIHAEHLGKSYGDKVAIADLSFDVLPGSVTGFLGPNGSGKSTTMRLMLGLDNGHGHTTFDGVPFRSIKHPIRHVGAVLEAKPYHPTRRARHHLRMLAAANAIPASRVDEVLAMVGLTSVARGRPKKFSLGMGQRLGLAAALLGDPHTLILDEPSNGLDPQGITWLRHLLQQLAGEGRSVFVSSHLLQEMALLADHLVVIGRGQLIASGPVEGFTKGNRRTVVVLRTPDIDVLGPALAANGGYVVADHDATYTVKNLSADRVGDIAFQSRARLHQLFTQEATLEEAFLDATGVAEEFIGQTRLGGPGGMPT